MSEESSQAPGPVPSERLRRWRLLIGGADSGDDAGLSADERAMDQALAALYDAGDESGSEPRGGGLGSSAPKVSRWLGDIRRYFPNTVVQVLQRDAVERLDLTRLLGEPEVLESIEPDIHLVNTLVQLSGVLPESSRASARQVVRTVVEEVERRIADRTRQAVTGALNRARRVRRPAARDIDWNRTIAANLKHYLPEQRTVIPQRLVGYGRYGRGVQRDVVVAIDQSASMAESVVYAAIFAAVLAGLRTLRTHLVAFGTDVVDLTERLADPVDVLFGTQVGGGTDINRAVAYCQTLIGRPHRTLFVLITDLFEGGNPTDLLRRMRTLREAGAQLVVLLALNDAGAPAFDHELAAALSELGIPAFACTPDAFPDLLAAALSEADLHRWSQDYQRARQNNQG